MLLDGCAHGTIDEYDALLHELLQLAKSSRLLEWILPFARKGWLDKPFSILCKRQRRVHIAISKDTGSCAIASNTAQSWPESAS